MSVLILLGVGSFVIWVFLLKPLIITIRFIFSMNFVYLCLGVVTFSVVFTLVMGAYLAITK